MAIINNLTDAWNSAGTAFTAIKMSVTNTASAAGSKVIDLIVDGASKFSVDKTGVVIGANLSGTNTGDQSLTGEATGSGTGAVAVTLVNSAVTGKVLTGFVSGAGTVAATDSILGAIQKLNGTDALKASLASPTFTGTVGLPAGQVVNGVTLTAAGLATNYLTAAGTYVAAGGGSGDFKSDGTVAMTGAISTTVGTMTSTVANGAAAKAFSHNTSTAYTTTAKIASWANGGVEKAYIQQDGTISTLGPVYCNTVLGSTTGANIVGFSLSPDSVWQFQLASTYGMRWSSSGSLYGIIDTGLYRNAAGIVEVNNGTAGGFRDLKLQTLFAGGGMTQTASVPMIDASQTWNNAAVAFTGIKTNITNTASAAGSLLMDLQVGGVSKFKIDKTGAVSTPLILDGGVGGTPSLSVGSGTILASASFGAVGSLQFSNGWCSLSGGNGSKATIGQTSNGSGGLALVTGSTTQCDVYSSGSTYADLKLRTLLVDNVVNLKVFTVATLPSAVTSGSGAQAYVSDATAPAYNTAVTGGGANKMIVASDGSVWRT